MVVDERRSWVIVTFHWCNMGYRDGIRHSEVSFSSSHLSDGEALMLCSAELVGR
jgi:hypothetical protein